MCLDKMKEATGSLFLEDIQDAIGCVPVLAEIMHDNETYRSSRHRLQMMEPSSQLNSHWRRFWEQKEATWSENPWGSELAATDKKAEWSHLVRELRVAYSDLPSRPFCVWLNSLRLLMLGDVCVIYIWFFFFKSGDVTVAAGVCGYQPPVYMTWL